MTADTTIELLIDSFGRIREQVADLTDGATPELLTFRPAPDANPIGWLLWHLTRVQDDHIAHLADEPQVWTTDGWVGRFALDLPDDATGYAATTAEVAALDVATAELLDGYHAAVHARTLSYVRRLDADELARIVDRRWDPPVTASARLVSVIGDCTAHLGQAQYVRGLAP